MSFFMYLLAFFCSPLYFLCRGRLGAAFLNGCFYALSIPLLFFGVGIFVWAFCAAHAFFDLAAAIREGSMQRQAELIARSMGRPLDGRSLNQRGN